MSHELHREAFNQMLEEFGYAGKEISKWSGLHPSKISRFHNGKTDLEAGEFFHLLRSCPPEAQDYFWKKFLSKSFSFEQLVATMDDSQVARMLHILGDYMQNSGRRSKLLQPITNR